MERDPWLAKRMEHATIVMAAEARIEPAVTAAMAQFLELARRLMLGEPGGDMLTAAGELPPSTDGWPDESFWEALLRQTVLPVLQIVWGEAFRRLALSATISDQPHRVRYLEQVFDRLRIWPQGAFEEIRLELLEAQESGETIAQQRDRIGRVLNIDAASRALQAEINRVEDELDNEGLDADERAALRAERGELYDEMHDDQGRWRWKAARIARTETMGALNGGSYSGAQAWSEDSGEVQYGQWLATSDERTRLSHQVADGQVVRLGEPFIVGGAPLTHPGMPGGPAHEVIQCRCTQLFLDEDEAPAAIAAYQVALSKLDPEEAALSTVLVASAHTQKEHTVSTPTLAVAGAPAPSTQGRLPVGWQGILAPMGLKTGDGRYLAVVEKLRTRDLPLVFEWQKVLGMGHDGAVIAGRIDRVWVDEANMIRGVGTWDLGSDDGQEAARLLADGFARWVSIDPDDITAEMGWFDKASGERVDAPSLEEIWAAEDAFWEGLPDPLAHLEQISVWTDYRLVGATFVAQPAFQEAQIEAVWEQADLDALITGALVASAAPVVITPDSAVVGFTPALVASGGAPFRPPASKFHQREYEGPTGLTVEEDGTVHGHLAQWDLCHTGFPGECKTAPHSKTQYAYFHVGSVLTEEGSVVPVGRVTLGGGHAALGQRLRAAQEHYDNAGAAVAMVRAYEDEFGIAVTGVLVPGTTEEQVTRLRLCPLSGDWREVGGHLELVAALAVNQPGFPIVRGMAASGCPQSLVAAGVLRTRPAAVRHVAERRAAASASPEQLAAAIVKEQYAVEDRRRRIQATAAAAGLTPAARRMRELAGTINTETTR